MPRISLWNPNQKEDYTYIDRISREHFEFGATGVYVHRYVGPKLDADGNDNSNQQSRGGIDELTIGDVLFLENRNRKYDSDIYELRGAYNPADTDLDLTQFGIFLSDDSIRMTFHLNDMVDRLGRKIMSGDVLELPHLREYFGLDEDKGAINRFYVVEDASYPSEGYGPKWWNHMWRVRAKMLTDSPEFEDIMNRIVEDDGTTSPGPGDDCCDETIRDILSQSDQDDEITDGLIAQAERDVEPDPLWYRNQHFFVFKDEDEKIGLVEWKGGTDIPPNGIPLAGQGERFPETLQLGDFFLRTDFFPAVLYQKQTNCRFVRIQMDEVKLPWTAANRVYDRFTENEDQVTTDRGDVIESRQMPSKILRPRTKLSINETMVSPSRLSADILDSEVRLTWLHNGVGDGFRVWRALDQASLFTDPELIDQIDDITQREYTDASAAPGTLYFYRVSVFDSEQERYTRPADIVTALDVAVTDQNQYVQDQIDNFVINPQDEDQ